MAVINANRRGFAVSALEAYQDVTRFGDEPDLSDLDYDLFLEVAGDLLADLFHLADSVGVDPETFVARGRLHYDEES